MKHIHRKWIRYSLSVIVLFCLLLQSMRDTITASDASSEGNTNVMHFIVRHWHADGSSEDIEGYLWEDGSWELKNGKIAEIIPASEGKPVTVKLIVKPNENETFTGFATAAGHEAVARERDEVQPNKSYLMISYNQDIHLAKVHVFYKDTMQEHKGDDLGAKETEIREDGKVYNTSEKGLHTDKTIAVAESSDDGRTFDLILESWFVDNNQADVGMVLDASGSMAFTSNDLEPIKMTEEQIKKYGKMTYIPQEDVNDILNPAYTDNSKLGYSGYTYFVYDPSTETKEYVPIGYWNGISKNITPPTTDFPQLNDLIGYYSFDSTEIKINEVYNLKGEEQDDSKVIFAVEPEDEGKLNAVSRSIPILKTGKAYINKGLDLARGYWDAAKSKAIQLDVKPNKNSFTVSFAVQGSSEKPLMWIGNKDQTNKQAWYGIYADTDTGETTVYSGKDITTADTDGRRKVDGKLTDADWNICTYVFEMQNGNDTKVTIYANSQEIGTGYIDGDIISDESVFVLGGSAWQCDYSDNPLWSIEKQTYLVDELYVYDIALTAADVKTLYEAMHNSTIESVYAATMPSDKDKTMAELRNAEINGKGEGWYYVSSNSNWSQIMNDQLLTSKSYRGIPLDEVIFNRIDEVPDKVKVNPQNGNTDEYIYTKNFTGSTNDNQAIRINNDDEWNGSIIFYIDNDGYLRCFFNGGTSQKRNDTDILNVDSDKWSANGSYCSYVYEKTDFQRIKTEALQYALGSFVTRLGEVSPDSRVSAVRFGTQNLVIAGDDEATKENLSNLVLLDWTKNTMESTGMLGLRRGQDRTAAEYEESDNNINQYNYILTGGTATWTGLQSYIDNLLIGNQEGTASKYLIIFTDGKDTTDESGEKKAIELAGKLKEEYGYTIYCVMLQSAGNKQEEAKTFLKKLSSSEEVYEADDVETLTEVFTTQILDELVGNLSEYTVQDYIDPRFNLVAADGTIIYLNNGGSITIDGNNLQIDNKQGYELTVMEVEDNYDNIGEKAILYYDGQKDMYYLQWQKQTIPACSVDALRLNVWRAKVTVRAKDDFLGGNAIFTNGNQEDMNKVFDPENEGHPSKNFPGTAANVELLKLTMENELNTVYKGQTISPEQFRNILGEKVKNNVYYEYLERYLNYISEQKEYEKIMSSLVSGSVVEIPYMYLPDNTGTNQTGKEHKNDIIGTLKYQWQECEDNGSGSLIPKTDNQKYDDFVTDDTNSRYYRLSIIYEPWSEEARKEENSKLTSNVEYSKPYYWAGKTQNEIKAFGVHQTDIVCGELVVEARVLLSDLLDMAGKNNGLLNMEESFTAVRIYDGKESTIKFKLPFRYSTEELLKLLPKADGDGYISIFSEPFTELPIGEYRISADNVTELEFCGISKRDILDENGHFSEKYSKEGKESIYAADSLQEENNNVIIFYLGIQSVKKSGQDDSSINLNARLCHVVVSYIPETDILSDTVSVVVDGVKHLSGRTLKQGEFIFELLDETGRSLRETTNEADGSFHFDKLTFNKVGIYSYILRERENNVNGITYDKKYYLVQIQVDRQEGRLTAKLIYKRGEQEQVEKAEFYNKYENNGILPVDSPSKTGDLTDTFILKIIMCIASLSVVIAVLIRKKKNISKQGK